MPDTLQTLLIARQRDPRALAGAIDIQGGRARILFGAVGDIPRITLGVEGNTVKVLYPDVGSDVPATAPAADQKAKIADLEKQVADLTGEVDVGRKALADASASVIDLTDKLAAAEATIAERDKALAEALAASTATGTAPAASEPASATEGATAPAGDAKGKKAAPDAAS